MKKTPKKKSSSKIRFQHAVTELPSNNDVMEKYVNENRIKINNNILDSIEYAMKKKLSAIELFSFKNSNFVVVLHKKDFKETLENIYEYSVEKEKFEVCVRVKKMISSIDKFGLVFNLKKT